MEEALIKQAKGSGYPDFFDIKVYETEFLPSLENKFGISQPTIIRWLKSKLLYPYEVDEESFAKGKR